IFPIILIGAKSDLKGDRQVPTSDAIEVAKSRGLTLFFECSSKTGKNVEKIFINITKLMLKNL
ncbi:MAG: hypothetical protein ACFFKA_09745, partial [Candidatus Thorarchaeota archaeon]